MDLKEKALIRNQLFDIEMTRIQLTAELKSTNKYLGLIELQKKRKLSSKVRKELEEQKKLYLQNKKDIQETLEQLKELSSHLKIQSSPRAYLYV